MGYGSITNPPIKIPTSNLSVSIIDFINEYNTFYNNDGLLSL